MQSFAYFLPKMAAILSFKGSKSPINIKIELGKLKNLKNDTLIAFLAKIFVIAKIFIICWRNGGHFVFWSRLKNLYHQSDMLIELNSRKNIHLKSSLICMAVMLFKRQSFAYFFTENGGHFVFWSKLESKLHHN